MELSPVALIIFIFILALLAFLKALFNKKGNRITQNYQYIDHIHTKTTSSNVSDYTSNYMIKRTLFSPAERSFFGILKQSLSEHYEIFGKVRIADVLSTKKGLDGTSWRISLSKITSKHFDYVLCDKKTLQILAVIELDDKSHNQLKTMERDNFVQLFVETLDYLLFALMLNPIITFNLCATR